MRLQYSIISDGSEGGCCTLVQITMLQYSIISDGSEEDEKWEKIQLCCSTAYFHMAVKANMQLTTRFISAGEHNIINIDLKASIGFFLEWR